MCERKSLNVRSRREEEKLLKNFKETYTQRKEKQRKVRMHIKKKGLEMEKNEKKKKQRDGINEAENGKCIKSYSNPYRKWLKGKQEWTEDGNRTRRAYENGDKENHIQRQEWKEIIMKVYPLSVWSKQTK